MFFSGCLEMPRLTFPEISSCDSALRLGSGAASILCSWGLGLMESQTDLGWKATLNTLSSQPLPRAGIISSIPGHSEPHPA